MLDDWRSPVNGHHGATWHHGATSASLRAASLPARGPRQGSAQNGECLGSQRPPAPRKGGHDVPAIRRARRRPCCLPGLWSCARCRDQPPGDGLQRPPRPDRAECKPLQVGRYQMSEMIQRNAMVDQLRLFHRPDFAPVLRHDLGGRVSSSINGFFEGGIDRRRDRLHPVEAAAEPVNRCVARVEGSENPGGCAPDWNGRPCLSPCPRVSLRSNPGYASPKVTPRRGYASRRLRLAKVTPRQGHARPRSRVAEGHGSAPRSVSIEDHQHCRGRAPDVALAVGNRPIVAAQRRQASRKCPLLIRSGRAGRRVAPRTRRRLSTGSGVSANGGSTQPTTG